jgi:hypothetical protein
MTKREKRLYALQRKVARLEAQREYGIKLLVRAVMELPNARKQVDRLRLNLFRHPVSDAGKVEDAAPVPTDHVAEDRSVPVDVPVAVEDDAGNEPLAAKPNDGLDIPTYLKRDLYDAAKRVASGNGTETDKTKVRIAKMKAKKTIKDAELTGKRRRMPLTGKAALDAIRRA